MFALTVTPDQRLKKNRITCMSKDPTIAGILMVGSCEVVSSTRPSDRDVRTACTNGRDEWYSEEFMEKLTDAELRFVIMHEGYHKAFRHLITWAHLWAICPDTANRAMDYYINIKLYDTYIKLSGGATDHTFIKMPSMVFVDGIPLKSSGTSTRKRKSARKRKAMMKVRVAMVALVVTVELVTMMAALTSMIGKAQKICLTKRRKTLRKR